MPSVDRNAINRIVARCVGNAHPAINPRSAYAAKCSSLSDTPIEGSDLAGSRLSMTTVKTPIANAIFKHDRSPRIYISTFSQTFNRGLRQLLHQSGHASFHQMVALLHEWPSPFKQSPVATYGFLKDTGRSEKRYSPEVVVRKLREVGSVLVGWSGARDGPAARCQQAHLLVVPAENLTLRRPRTNRRQAFARMIGCCGTIWKVIAVRFGSKFRLEAKAPMLHHPGNVKRRQSGMRRHLRRRDGLLFVPYRWYRRNKRSA